MPKDPTPEKNMTPDKNMVLDKNMAPEPDERGLVPAAARRFTTLVSGLSAAIMTLDISIVNVALPDIADDLGTTLDTSQWIVNAYTLAFAALLLGVGSVSDLIGRRTMFLAGHLIFLLASVGCMLSTGDVMLIVLGRCRGRGRRWCSEPACR